MIKTQLYLPKAELAALRRLAKKQDRSVADLVRESVREKYLRPLSGGPVALWSGPSAGSSADHDAAFDQP